MTESQLLKRLFWTALILIATGAVLTLTAQPSSFWISPKTAMRFDGLPIHSSTNPMFDFFLGHGWPAYLAGVGLYGVVIWLAAALLPIRLALVTELAVILGLCFSESNWIVVRWHTGTGGAMLYTAVVALGLTMAVLPTVRERDDDGLMRLCWLMAFTTTIDGAFTLIGQPATYWRNHMFVHEGNPLATFFLEKGWWAYAAYISGEIAVPWLLAKRVPIFTGWAIVFYMTLGGLSGGSNWLFYEWRMGLQAPVIYAVILSFMIVQSLVKRSQAAEPDGLPRDVPAECKLWPC